jgi:hypothetical protein
MDCQYVCPALDISSSFYTILKACQLFLIGKDEKADRLCRTVWDKLTEKEKSDMVYELSSVAQAFVQESLLVVSQNRKTQLFDQLSEKVVHSEIL